MGQHKCFEFFIPLLCTIKKTKNMGQDIKCRRRPRGKRQFKPPFLDFTFYSNNDKIICPSNHRIIYEASDVLNFPHLYFVP